MHRVLAACAIWLLVGCVTGVGVDIPQVDGPVPDLEPAPDDIEPFAIVCLLPGWTLSAAHPSCLACPCYSRLPTVRSGI